MNFAVIETGGKQYKVAAGEKIKIEKLDGAEGSPGDSVVFNRVLLLHKDGKTQIGAPYVAGAEILGCIARHGRGKKVIVFKYHSKTRYRKKKGHRQHYTEVEIAAIRA